jgi:hypothetical protein
MCRLLTKARFLPRSPLSKASYVGQILYHHELYTALMATRHTLSSRVWRLDPLGW